MLNISPLSLLIFKYYFKKIQILSILIFIYLYFISPFFIPPPFISLSLSFLPFSTFLFFLLFNLPLHIFCSLSFNPKYLLFVYLSPCQSISCLPLSLYSFCYLFTFFIFLSILFSGISCAYLYIIPHIPFSLYFSHSLYISPILS